MLNDFLKRQDVQIHSKFSDGKNSLEEMVTQAIQLRIKSIIITDHACGWFNADGTESVFFDDDEVFSEYLNQINSLRDRYKNKIDIFSGLEVEVNIDGSLRLAQGITGKESDKFGVDILLGAIHSESFQEEYSRTNNDNASKRSFLMENIKALIQNKSIDIFAHPFQAIHGHFSENFNTEEIHYILNLFKSEWESGHNIYFEINGKKYPSYDQWKYNMYETGQLKTNDQAFLIEYLKYGGKFVFGSDAHSYDGFTKTDFSVIHDLNLSSQDQYILTR